MPICETTFLLYAEILLIYISLIKHKKLTGKLEFAEVRGT